MICDEEDENVEDDKELEENPSQNDREREEAEGIENEEDVEKLQEDLKKLHNWGKKNNMEFTKENLLC